MRESRSQQCLNCMPLILLKPLKINRLFQLTEFRLIEIGIENDDFVRPRDVEFVTRLLVQDILFHGAVAQQADLQLQGFPLFRQCIELRHALRPLTLELLRGDQSEIAMNGMIPEIGKECDRNDGHDKPAQPALSVMLGPHTQKLPNPIRDCE